MRPPFPETKEELDRFMRYSPYIIAISIAGYFFSLALWIFFPDTFYQVSSPGLVIMMTLLLPPLLHLYRKARKSYRR